MNEILGFLLPGFVFTVLGASWITNPVFNYFKSLRYKNVKYESRSNYNVKGCLIPVEGVVKVTGGLVCFLTCYMTRNEHEKPFHSALYLGYIISGVVDIVNFKTNVLPKGSGYVALIAAHLTEVLLLHFQQTQDLKVKIKELMVYNLNDTNGDVVFETNSHYQYYQGLTSIENHAQFLLSLTILCACASTIMEAKFRRCFPFALGRGIFGMVHGTWLCQMGLLAFTSDKYDPEGDYDCYLNSTFVVHLAAVLHGTTLIVVVCHCQIKRDFRITVLEPLHDTVLNM